MGCVTTLELAKAIDEAIEQQQSGLIQLSNGVGISKYDLLRLFKELWHKQDVEILPYDVNRVDKSITKSRSFEYTVPDYRLMLQEQAAWMNAHKDLYIHYF